MNEHVFAELEALEPQHERRIIQLPPAPGTDLWVPQEFLSYCTICAHYQRGPLPDVAAAWATHLEDVAGAIGTT